MEPHIGETFDGVISGISSMGIYIELPNTVEGMVKIDEFKDDYYFFDEEHYQLIGKNQKKCYKLGQRVKVRLEEADKLMRSIIFTIVDEEEEEDPSPIAE